MSTGSHRGRRPLWTAVRSMLIPGWGQLAVRRRRLGWALVVATVVVVGAGVGVAVVVERGTLLALLVDPAFLSVLLAVNVLVAVFRVAVTAHAWILAGGRRVITAVLLAALVVAPHALVAHAGIETRRTLVTVFADRPEPAAPPSTVSTTTPSPATTSPPTTTLDLPPTSQPAPPDPTLTTTTTLPDPIADRYNVLLLGGDAGLGRSGLRTDSVILVSVDLATGDTAVFGIPRNWGGLRLSDGTPVPGRILNEVYEWGRRHPALFGGADPGAGAVVDVVATVTGVEIDHFVLVDLTGFAPVVDALGGLTIDVPRAVFGPRYDAASGGYRMIWIPRGEQTLDGAAALAYVRERYQSSDYDRMARQRCVLSALVESADPLAIVTGLTELLDAIERHVTTDIPLDHVPGLARLSDRVVPDEIRVIGFDHRWGAGRDAEGHAIPDVARIRAAVAATITDPDAAPDHGATTIGGACG